MSDPRIKEMQLYAWVGEDELGSGEVGLKQGIVPAGCIALVACKLGKMTSADLVNQLQAQAQKYGKTIRLCRFTYAEELLTLEP